MSKSISRVSGFTILETILAIGILAIGLLALLAFFPVGLRSTKASQQSNVAANLIQWELETVIAGGYDNATGTTGINGIIEAKHRLASTTDNPYYYYQRQTTVGYVDGNLNASATDTGLKRISVIVSWTDPLLKRERNLEIDTLINKR